MSDKDKEMGTEGNHIQMESEQNSEKVNFITPPTAEQLANLGKEKPLPPMKVVLIGTEEPLSSSTLEALALTFKELGEEVNFGVMLPKEVMAYINAKNEDASQKNIDDVLTDPENVKRAEALAKKLDGLFKTEGKWCNVDKLVKMINWNRGELLNNLMTLQTFGFVKARKTVANKLLVQFILTPQQRSAERINEAKIILEQLKAKRDAMETDHEKDVVVAEIQKYLVSLSK